MNWLPTSPERSIHVAATAERWGWDGIGVGDSPYYDDCYTTISMCLEHTEVLAIGTSVTNPVTRHWSTHAAAVRALGGRHSSRAFFGVGRGDSAVRTHGLAPAHTAELDETVTSMSAAAAPLETPPPVLVSAAGPVTAQLAGAAADGVIAGGGADPVAVGQIKRWAEDARPATAGPLQLWGSVRLGVAADEGEQRAMRQAFLPRALSAARFNLGRSFEQKGIPGEYVGELRQAFDRYDFNWHGRSGTNPNATLLSHRPDIETWLIDRYAIVGDESTISSKLTGLARAGCDGVFCSILFEDPVTSLDRLSHSLTSVGLLQPNKEPTHA